MVQQPLPASALQIIAVYQDDSVVLLHGAQQGAALGPVLWLSRTRTERHGRDGRILLWTRPRHGACYIVVLHRGVTFV